MSLSSDSWKIKHIQFCRNSDICSAYCSPLEVSYTCYLYFTCPCKVSYCVDSAQYLLKLVRGPLYRFLNVFSWVLLSVIVPPQFLDVSFSLSSDFLLLISGKAMYLDTFAAIVNVNSLIHHWCWMVKVKQEFPYSELTSMLVTFWWSFCAWAQLPNFQITQAFFFCCIPQTSEF